MTVHKYIIDNMKTTYERDKTNWFSEIFDQYHWDILIFIQFPLELTQVLQAYSSSLIITYFHHF